MSIKTNKISLPVFFLLIHYIGQKKNNTWSNIYYEMKITPCHAMNQRKLLLKHELITIEKQGRVCLLNLTTKGKKLLDSIDVISSYFGGIEKMFPSSTRRENI